MEINVITPTTPVVFGISLNITQEEILTAFINSLDVKDNSKKLYYRTLKLFFNWVRQKNYSLNSLTRVEILQYKAELLASGKSSLTTTSYLTSLRVFYEWTEVNNIYPNICNKIKSPKREKEYKKQPLTSEQGAELLAYYEKTNLKYYAVVSLLIRTGLRTIEVIRANVEDITTMLGHRVLLVHGKGRDEKDNFVELRDKAFNPISQYLATRNIPPTGPLFVSDSKRNKNKRLTTRTISKIVKDGLKAIGLTQKGYSAHSLRHTGATAILKATGDIEKVRLFCRHNNPATTLIYTHTLTKERKLQNSGEALLDEIF